jgi:hypothetical protein
MSGTPNEKHKSARKTQFAVEQTSELHNSGVMAETKLASGNLREATAIILWCPLSPRKLPWQSLTGVSAKGQNRTHALQKIENKPNHGHRLCLTY